MKTVTSIFNGGFEGFYLPMKIVTMTSARSKLDKKIEVLEALRKRQALMSISGF